MTKKVGAEFIGSFWLVLGGCGSAVLAAPFPNVGSGKPVPLKPDDELKIQFFCDQLGVSCYD